MRTNFTLAAAILVGMLLFCGCASTPKADLSSLQGNWSGEEIGGQNGECRMTIEGDTIKFQGALQQDWYVGTVALDTKTNPKQATMLVSECGLRQYVNKTARGIYKLEGRKLTMAVHEPGNEAVPTAFGRDPTTQRRAFVFTRQ